jgi:hypothetical protein
VTAFKIDFSVFVFVYDPWNITLLSNKDQSRPSKGPKPSIKMSYMATSGEQ